MTRWKNNTVYCLLNLVIISSLLIMTISPTVITSIVLLEDNLDYNNVIRVPRLTNESITTVLEGCEPNRGNSDSFSQSSNKEFTNYAIKTQEGQGGGNVQIWDSFNLTSTEFLNTQNSLSGSTGLPTEQEASRTISNIPDFSRQELLFNISDVTAQPDWRLQENRVGARTWDSDPVSGDDFHHIAMSFNVSEDYANLTSVRIRISLYAAGSGPSGLIYITNASGGAPDVNLTNKVALVQSVAWRTYTFSENITLEKGQTYFVVMESTFSDTNNYWIWNYELDNDYGTDGGDVYRKRSIDPWTPETGTDLPLQIQVLPVEPSGAKKKYGSANDIEILYNTTAGERRLTSFSWFDANTTEKHNFISNTSVSFTLNFIGNFTYTTAPITGITSYSVQNNSVSFWNITFSTAKVSTNYSVENHLISIKEIPSDWNGTKIYWNDSSTPEYLGPLDANVNVTYINSSSTMLVNSSTLAEYTTWHIWFDAPNYISSFNWQFSNYNVTTATTMDVLEANYTFVTPNIGGRNFSIWIEAPDGTLVNSSIDNPFGTNDLYNWDINQSIHNTFLTDKANGTYQTYAFWENTTNNQLGFYTRNITVFIHTTFFVDAPNEVLEDTWLNMTVHYNATHIDTGVNNGNVTGLFGWNDTSETFNQPVALGLYNLSIWIKGSDHDPGDKTNVTIYAEMPWHQNHTETWNITVVSNTSFSVIDVPTNLILEYGQTYLLKVNYLYMGAFLDEANMTVDGDNENYTKETDHYSYLLNTRNYNSGESYFNLEIRLNRSGYLTQRLYFNLTVTLGPTSIHQVYTPIIPSIYYTENYTFSVFYNNTVDNKGILNAISYTSHSSAIDFWYFNSSGYYFFNLSSSDLSLGSYQINITLNHSNYQESNILLTFNIVEMPTEPLESYSISSDQIMVEETITVSIEGYQTYKFEAIGTIDNALIVLNDSSVDSSHVIFTEDAPFSIELDTLGIQYGKYNMTVILSKYGYESQAISFNVSIDGYETIISVEIEPGKNIQQGEDIIFIATLAYLSGDGTGAGITQQVLLGGVEITFYIVLEYENGTTKIYEAVKQTDNSNYQATYTIDGIYTKDATKFTNITIYSAPGLSGLPYTYSMPTSELETYKILPPAIDILEVITAVLIAVVTVLICGFIAINTVSFVRRRRRTRKQLILRHDLAVEQSFEDIKSIRLIIARHESGLQFYSEKTIAELSTDTDALSGMSAALSSFMEEVSESMVSRPEELRTEKIEVMSREGLHMLVWHGYYSSLIIISEIRLPEYFKDRLGGLGRELEAKFVDDLQDFYSTDQIPSSIVKKMVRKYIPLHYFSAFVLNEGVLTLESIKLSKKDQKMFTRIKEVLFEKKGVQYFFSEQIISHLSKKYKRSEAIEFLDRAINWNLLVECSQEDLLQLGQ